MGTFFGFLVKSVTERDPSYLGEPWSLTLRSLAVALSASVSKMVVASGRVRGIVVSPAQRDYNTVARLILMAKHTSWKTRNNRLQMCIYVCENSAGAATFALFSG